MGFFPEIELPTPKSSIFDLSHAVRTSMAPGVLYPITWFEALPGDIIKMDINALVKTYPTIAPLMGSFDIQVDAYFVPYRLYMPALHGNKLVSPQALSLPTISLDIKTGANSDSPDTDFYLGKHSVLEALGVPQHFRAGDYTSYDEFDVPKTKINALPLLAYWDIYRSFYVDTQKTKFRTFATGFESTPFRPSWNDIVSSSTYDKKPFPYYEFDKSSIDTFIESFKTTPHKDISLPVMHTNNFMLQYGLRCYKHDYVSSLLSGDTSALGLSATDSFVSIANSKFSVNQLRTANALQRFIDRIRLGGGRYGEYIRSQWAIDTSLDLEIPQFIGSFSSTMQFEDIIQTSSDNDDSGQPLGSMAGKGLGFMTGRETSIRCQEYGLVMYMFSIIPKPDYYQGIHRSLLKTKFMDLYNPQFDNIGLQQINSAEIDCHLGIPNSMLEVPDGVEEVTYDDSGVSLPFISMVGYLPAWSEYKTMVNRVFGEFADTLDYWALTRKSFNYRFTKSANNIHDPDTDYYITIKPVLDNTPYICPQLYNYCFSDTDPNAENFLVQFAIKVTANRLMSKNPPRL